MNSDIIGKILIGISIFPSLIVIGYAGQAKRTDQKLNANDYKLQIIPPLALSAFLLLFGSYFLFQGKQEDYVYKFLIIITGIFAIQFGFSSWMMSLSRIRWAT
jgi:hypothetical protein